MQMLKALSALSLFAFAATASANVTFDPASGTGFVDKADVQLAYGWNAAALRKNAGDVTFRLVSTQQYAAVCSWTTADGARGQQTLTVSLQSLKGVGSAVTYDQRTRTQIAGFTLTGFNGGSADSIGTFPVVGASCPGSQGVDGTWTSVTMTSSALRLDALYQGAMPAKVWPPAM